MTEIVYKRKGLTGGTDDDLDGIDGVLVSEGQIAIVDNNSENFFYRLNETSGATANGGTIVAPATNAGNKRWILQASGVLSPGYSGKVKGRYFPSNNGAITDHGAVSGSDYAAGNLKSVIDTIGSSRATIELPAGAYDLITTLTVPENITIRFQEGAYLTGGVVFSGSIDTGYHQKIFDTGITISGIPRGLDKISVKWFGATGDGVTDDAPACRAAIAWADSFGNIGGMVYFPMPTVHYKMASGDPTYSTMVLVINANNTGLLGQPGGFVAGANAATVRLETGSFEALLHIRNDALPVPSTGVNIEHMRMYAAPANANYVLKGAEVGALPSDSSVTQAVIRNNQFYGGAIATTYFQQIFVSEISHNVFISSSGWGIILGGPAAGEGTCTSIDFRDNFATNCGMGGYLFRNTVYSTITSNAADKNTGPAYEIKRCSITMLNNGCEQCDKGIVIDNDGLAFTGGGVMLLGHYFSYIGSLDIATPINGMIELAIGTRQLVVGGIRAGSGGGDRYYSNILYIPDGGNTVHVTVLDKSITYDDINSDGQYGYGFVRILGGEGSAVMGVWPSEDLLTTMHKAGAFCCTNVQSRKTHAANIAAFGGFVDGNYVAHIATDNCYSTGTRGVVLSSQLSRAEGVDCLAAASNESWIDHVGVEKSVVIASQFVGQTKDFSVCGGYDATGPAKSPAFRKWELDSMTGDLRLTAASVTTSHTFTDYGEYFENESAEEFPTGTVLTLRDDRCGMPVNGADFILGVVSETAAIRSGDSPFSWQGIYKRSEWGAIITEPMEYFVIPGEEDEQGDGKAKRKTYTGRAKDFVGDIPVGAVRKTRNDPVRNPEFDPARTNVPRSARKNEWTLVGLMGQLRVRVKADAAGYGFIDALGMPTNTETRLRVMKTLFPYDETKGYAVVLCLLR